MGNGKGREPEAKPNVAAEAGSGKHHDKHGEKKRGKRHDKFAAKQSENAKR